MPKSTWAANWIDRKNTTIGKCTASRMRRETLCGCIMQQWQGENRGNCISLGQGRIVLSIVCQTLSIDSIQHARALRNRLVVQFDRLKPCPPDVRLPTTPPHQRLQSVPGTVASPVGTNLEVLDDFSPDCTPSLGPMPLPSSVPLTPHAPISPCPRTPTHSHDTTSASSAPLPRYPRRVYAPPDRFVPMVTH